MLHSLVSRSQSMFRKPQSTGSIPWVYIHLPECHQPGACDSWGIDSLQCDQESLRYLLPLLARHTPIIHVEQRVAWQFTHDQERYVPARQRSLGRLDSLLEVD